MPAGLVLALIFALLVVSAFGAMASMALSRISRVKAHHLAQERQNRSARRLETIAEDPAPFLNVMLLITVLAHATATVLATSLAVRLLETGGEIVAAVAMTLAIFVFSEIAPRNYAVQNSETAALFVATPVVFLGRLLRPVGKLFIHLSNAVMLLVPGRRMPKGPFVTEDEIRHMVDVAEEEEEIEEEERELIHSIFEFGDTVVREVMVPRPDMVTVSADATVGDALETITKAGYSRVPIYEGDNDNIVAVLYAKDLLKRVSDLNREAPVKEFGRNPFFVPEQKRISDLLREMQRQRFHLAIVVDEYGGTAGLVTIEDLLEEIVGEIVDEYDREEPLVESMDDGKIRVDARVPIEEVNELLDVELPHDEWDTVGGLVFGLIGRVPRPGEKVRHDSVELVTEGVSGRRIQKVTITKASSSEPSE